MSLRVIGAGMGRTGTMSLKIALSRLLGGPCYHMVEVFERPAHFGIWAAAGRGEPVDWKALMAGFSAAVDWPSAAFWPELSKAFPDAFILLSTRDSASWWKSASETIFAPEGAAARVGPMKEMLDSVLSSRFTTDFYDRETAIAAYERNNAHVRATAPASRLVEWTSKDGWGPLCKMLGVPVPNEPFPHANTTEEFKARVAAGHGPPKH
ncbi:MAG: sulfotransferase family protein [Polyangiaceae bacterium]